MSNPRVAKRIGVRRRKSTRGAGVASGVSARYGDHRFALLRAAALASRIRTASAQAPDRIPVAADDRQQASGGGVRRHQARLLADGFDRDSFLWRQLGFGG
jgi:hypothetical protein